MEWEGQTEEDTSEQPAVREVIPTLEQLKLQLELEEKRIQRDHFQAQMV